MSHINPWRYRGKYTDRATGFIYMQTRYYDPVVRRFINPDNYMLLPLLAMTGELNMQAYALQNPITYQDPTGQAAISKGMKLAIAGAIIGFVFYAGVIGYLASVDWGSMDAGGLWDTARGSARAGRNNVVRAWNWAQNLRSGVISRPAVGTGTENMGTCPWAVPRGNRLLSRGKSNPRDLEGGMSHRQRERFQREIENYKRRHGMPPDFNIPWRELIALAEIARRYK